MFNQNEVESVRSLLIVPADGLVLGETETVSLLVHGTIGGQFLVRAVARFLRQFLSPEEDGDEEKRCEKNGLVEDDGEDSGDGRSIRPTRAVTNFPVTVRVRSS